MHFCSISCQNRRLPPIIAQTRFCSAIIAQFTNILCPFCHFSTLSINVFPSPDFNDSDAFFFFQICLKSGFDQFGNARVYQQSTTPQISIVCLRVCFKWSHRWFLPILLAVSSMMSLSKATFSRSMPNACKDQRHAVPSPQHVASAGSPRQGYLCSF